VSGIRAHQDGAAADAASELGAQAYATGSSVAFADTPDLHTAAHEAAHVVQQRQGVQLAGGVGTSGDVYEQQADAVADRVVAGESAQDLLGATPTTVESNAAGDVQLLEDEDMAMDDAAYAADEELSTAVTNGIAQLESWIMDFSSDIQSLFHMDREGLTALGEEAQLAIDELTTKLYATAGMPDIEATGLANQLVGDFMSTAVPEFDAKLAAARANIVTSLGGDRIAAQSVIDKPRESSFGQVAAAHSTRMATGHQLSVLNTGKGTHQGTHSSRGATGVRNTDCITSIMDTIGATFASFGQASTWSAIKSLAYSRSESRGASGLTGIDLQTALISKAGWKAIFVAADLDPNSTENRSTDHHIVEYNMAKRGVPMFGGRGAPGVKPVAAVGDYSPEEGDVNEVGLDQIRQIPFGFACASGGMHTAMIASGEIHDCHWTEEADSTYLFEKIPIESWDWRSAVIVVPGEDIKRIFNR